MKPSQMKPPQTQPEEMLTLTWTRGGTLPLLSAAAAHRTPRAHPVTDPAEGLFHGKMPGETHLIVGIDFGTTFSGVAWVISTRPDDIQVITSWDDPSYRNADRPKVRQPSATKRKRGAR